MLRIALARTISVSALRSRGALLAWAVFAAGCGARVDSTVPHCDDRRSCDSGGLSGRNSGDSYGAVDGRQRSPDSSRYRTAAQSDDSGGPDSSGSNAQRSCPQALDVGLSYYRDSLASEPFMPAFDEQGQIIAPEIQLTPCGGCMSLCSPVPTEGCDAQDQCVSRHCDCTATGCEGGIPTGDFCLCAATCMGAGQEPCLESWLVYGQCIASCAGVCLQDSAL